MNKGLMIMIHNRILWFNDGLLIRFQDDKNTPLILPMLT